MSTLISVNRSPAKSAGRLLAIALLVSLFLAFNQTAMAGAQISISPTRIVFEGRNRTASVTLINRGNESSTFRVSFERKRMTEDGQFEAIKNPRPGEVFADQMIRYSPRQVVLPPGKTQVVRLLLRKPPNLPDGEYRSHMLFSEVPEQSNKSIEAQTGKQKQMSISIKPVLGISIPVIIRQGATSAEIQIVKSHLAFLDQGKSRALLTLKMKRTGNRSVYGDVIATYHKGNSKEGVVVAQVNGIAVYSPNYTRTLKLNLQTPAGVKLEGGKIDVVYRMNPAEGNKILAQGQVAVPTGN